MEQPEILTLGPEAAARGGRTLPSEVFQASYRRLVVQLYGVVGDAAEAEDLVQEAFVRASVAGRRFLEVDNPEAWLRTTAVNLHRSRWRRMRNQARLPPPPGVTGLPGLEQHAERLVNLPDLAPLERRAHRRRTRRHVAATAGAAAVVAATGLLVNDAIRQHAEPPAKVPEQHAPPYPGSLDRPRLEAGTYELSLSPDLTRPTVLLTVPEGWRGSIGPNRDAGKHGYVGVLALDVNKVTTEPCQPYEWGMRDVEPTRQDLVDALVALPRVLVTQQPSPDDRLGHPGTHLRLRATDGVECRNGQRFWVASTDSGLVESAGPGSTSDIWVVDVGARPALVSATWSPGTPRWAREELDEVVSSIRFQMPEE